MRDDAFAPVYAAVPAARRSQNQKNSTVSTPRAVMKDSTSMPSLNTTLPRMSAALNDNADVMPGAGRPAPGPARAPLGARG